ncbi:unnamed protein product, partial [Rotaria sp. Silwood2]
NAPSNSRQTLFVLVISLIDDSEEKIIHSYEQLSYLPMRDEYVKFNVYLHYSTRPKSSTNQYAVHIDIYEMSTLNYRGSQLILLKFPFLPVERIAVQLNIPHANNIVQTCTNQQCIHGECIRYLNDPENVSFCQCKLGWTGRYCTIPQICTCSSDSLCVGIAANNRSICVCPINNYWSQPFHIAFVELSTFQYYLVANEKVDYSSVIVRNINPSDRCRSINEIFIESIMRMHLIQRIKYYHLPCRNRSSNLSCFYDEIHMCLCQDFGDQRLANCFLFNHHIKLDDLTLPHNQFERECSEDYSFNSSILSTSSIPSSTPLDSGMSSIYACEYFLYLFILLLCLHILYTQ